MFEIVNDWDKKILVWGNCLGIEQYDNFWIFVTQIESWIPLFSFYFFLIFFFYKFKKGFVILCFLLATFAITFAFTELTKNSVARLRPNNAVKLAGLIRVLQTPTSYSFFSGHASSSFSITVFVVLVLRKFSKWIYIAFLWPLLFVISRIYVGVHYPSDIIVGAFAGTLIALLGYQTYKKTASKMLSNNTRNRESISNR